jgi:hypothetical protein
MGGRTTRARLGEGAGAGAGRGCGGSLLLLRTAGTEWVQRTAYGLITHRRQREAISEFGGRIAIAGPGSGARGVWRWRPFAVRQDGDRHTAVRITHHRPRTGRHSTNMAYCIWHNARQAGRHGGCPEPRHAAMPVPFLPLPLASPASVVRRPSSSRSRSSAAAAHRRPPRRARSRPRPPRKAPAPGPGLTINWLVPAPRARATRPRPTTSCRWVPPHGLCVASRQLLVS